MRIYCDANGNPDPNGDYQLINGKVCIRDGRSVGFNLLHVRDASGRGAGFFTDAAMTVTDSQMTQFRDSPAGREFVAYLRSSPSQGHPTSLAMAADAEDLAIRQHLAGGRVSTCDAAAVTAAHQRMEDAWHAQDPNAWRRTAAP